MTAPGSALSALSALSAVPALPGQPRIGEQPVFAEPWQAKGFALALALHERGLFTWAEWAQALAAQIALAQAAGDADTGDTYYRHWVAALETMVAAKGASSNAELDRYRHAWDHSADRTPHGAPIELSAADFEADDSDADPDPDPR
jgi:nitrile hydratase accessory protein